MAFSGTTTTNTAEIPILGLDVMGGMSNKGGGGGGAEEWVVLVLD